MMSVVQPRVQIWLRHFKWALASVPTPESEDIFAEVESHLREALGAGATPETLLEQFGAPEAYARLFVDDMQLSRAIGSQRGAAMLEVVVQRAHRSTVAAVAGVALAACAALFVMALAISVLKVIDPSHVGVWRSNAGVLLGKIDDPTAATDILGSWLVPTAMLVMCLAWFGGRIVLLRGVRTIAQRERRKAREIQ